MDFVVVWYIVWMELWGEDYFNMVGQAYIEIGNNCRGHLRFGLVSVVLEGRVVSCPEERFEFTFEGYDEYDPFMALVGSRKLDEDTVESEVALHDGDELRFRGKKTKDFK